jgi:hypothetical protein
MVDLAERVEAIEKRQTALLEMTANMRSLLQTYDRDMASTHVSLNLSHATCSPADKTIIRNGNTKSS